jgi:HEAT repeat protein
MLVRYVLLALGVAILSGCGTKPPLTVHGKPVAAWVEALSDPSPAVRKKAVTALGFVGDADPAAIPALIEALEDRDAAVRGQAVLALLNLGPQARDAIPALEQALQDTDARVRANAAKALQRVRGE